MKEYRVIKEFTPIFTRVLIKREDASLLKKAGDAKIILPDKIKDSYQSAEGVIVKVGDDCVDEVKSLIGSKVLFAKFNGEDMIINDEQHVLLDQGDIFGKVER